MRPGPARKPSAIKRLHGTWRADRENDKPEMAGAIPACPEELSDEAKNEWLRVSQELYDAGLMSKVDRAALAGYCRPPPSGSSSCKRVLSELRPGLPSALRALPDDRLLTLVNWSIIAAFEAAIRNVER